MSLRRELVQVFLAPLKPAKKMLTSTQDYSSILSEERNKVLDTLPSSKSTDNHAASLVKTRHGTFRQDVCYFHEQDLISE